MMGFFDMSEGSRFFAFPEIPDADNAVCAATADDVSEFVVEGEVGDGGGGL